ncbi:hypothetical protein ACFWP5_13055 [Streptomyces sp. NPDC058469]|uniref:hypothetical protein n=1 Tax=Streptomyces sp. NPDC058469 TaxID=3346514 RepID=UPI00364843BC
MPRRTLGSSDRPALLATPAQSTRPTRLTPVDPVRAERRRAAVCRHPHHDRLRLLLGLLLVRVRRRGHLAEGFQLR